MITADDLRQEVATVFGEIVAAKRLVGSGRIAELDGLDTRIDSLCKAVLELPRKDGRVMLPLLNDLRAQLDELAGALKTASATEPRPSAP